MTIQSHLMQISQFEIIQKSIPPSNGNAHTKTDQFNCSTMRIMKNFANEIIGFKPNEKHMQTNEKEKNILWPRRFLTERCARHYSRLRIHRFCSPQFGAISSVFHIQFAIVDSMLLLLLQCSNEVTAIDVQRCVHASFLFFSNENLQ